MDTQTRGKQAEDLACRYLQGQGLQLLHRNYRSKRGEIDLILQDTDSLVFVEVRYRQQPGFGSGAESVDARKQSKLVACARYFLQTHANSASQPCRFDVVSVNGASNDIDWIQNAFSAAE